LALLCSRLALEISLSGRVTMLAALVGAATALAIVSWTIPGRRLLPYWGRAADMAHTLMAVSLVPIALGVLGIYQTLRAAHG
jgi:hypothetical protein